MIVDKSTRNEAKAKLNKQELPTVFYNHYLVYKYKDLNSIYLIGFNELSTTQKLQKDLQSKCDYTYITDEYPYEIMLHWKKKS